ncbi:hypothetical protein D3C73_875630 [compost metagenome]
MEVVVVVVVDDVSLVSVVDDVLLLSPRLLVEPTLFSATAVGSWEEASDCDWAYRARAFIMLLLI